VVLILADAFEEFRDMSRFKMWAKKRFFEKIFTVKV
jgi:hypothetical protein